MLRTVANFDRIGEENAFAVLARANALAAEGRDIINLGIGQGDMGVTPLQMARYVAAVGNKGKLVTPHLVDSLRHPESGATVFPDLPPAKDIPIEEKYFDLVRQGMRMVMEQGTGVAAQIPGIPSGGKTGTAQNPPNPDHGWFAGFSGKPGGTPEIVVNESSREACCAYAASQVASRARSSTSRDDRCRASDVGCQGVGILLPDT